MSSRINDLLMNKVHRGFTLIELMVALTVASGLVLAIAQFVGNTAARSGSAERASLRSGNLASALALLRSDIENFGTGLPIDIFTQSRSQLTRPEIVSQINNALLYTISDVNSNSGPDTLTLGGSATAWSPAAGKIYLVRRWTPATGKLELYRPDFIDINPNSWAPGQASYLEPSYDGLAFFERLDVVHPQNGPASSALVSAQLITAPNPGTLTVDVLGGAGAFNLRVPQALDYVFLYRNLEGLPVVSRFPQVQWFINAQNQLVRRYIPNPATPGIFADRIILNEALDFQLEFLVWRCNTMAPQWVNHLLNEAANSGEFAAGGAYDGGESGIVGRANRYLVLKERLIAIRTTLLVREPRTPGTVANEDAFIGGSNNIVVQDRTLTVSPTNRTAFNYFIAEQIADPLNFRIKTSIGSQENFPPIRYAALDQWSHQGTGVCVAGRDTSNYPVPPIN